MVALQPFVSEFTIVGRLEDLVINSKGHIKYLALSTSEEDYLVTVAKSQKSTLSRYLKPGCYLKVTGMRKHKIHQAKVEYKAYTIELLSAQFSTKTAIAPQKNLAKILVCQGSSCCKQGSQAIYQTLITKLKAKGISNVEIKFTGCMKQCKQAPMLIMPVRNSYSRVKPEQISQLVNQHFE